MKTQESVKQLMRFPLHIVQKITRSSSRDKSALVADFAFRLDAMDIYLEQSPIADNGIVVKAFGKQIARIDATRGKQEYKLVETGAEWLKDWDTLLDDLMLLAISVGEDKPFGDDELSQVASDYEDATDASMTDDERDFIREFGELADDILSQIGRTDTLRLVKDDRGNYRVCDDERDGEDILWTQSDSRLWGTSVYKWGQLTPNPLEHLTDYVNKLNQSSND